VSVMVLHAFGRSTSRMARRVTFFRLDLAPRVATSLVRSGCQFSYQDMTKPKDENEPREERDL
jgi:hypothetical protein